MACSRRIATLMLGILAISNALADGAAPGDPANDPEIQNTLTAMKNASTWHHPDLFGMTTGMRYYAQHRYDSARKLFEYGALHADKLSQLSLGLMYQNGEGTPKDLVSAYAWMDLAAE